MCLGEEQWTSIICSGDCGHCGQDPTVAEQCSIGGSSCGDTADTDERGQHRKHISDCSRSEHGWAIGYSIARAEDGRIRDASYRVASSDRSEERRVGKECRGRGWGEGGGEDMRLTDALGV